MTNGIKGFVSILNKPSKAIIAQDNIEHVADYLKGFMVAKSNTLNLQKNIVLCLEKNNSNNRKIIAFFWGIFFRTTYSAQERKDCFKIFPWLFTKSPYIISEMAGHFNTDIKRLRQKSLDCLDLIVAKNFTITTYSGQSDQKSYAQHFKDQVSATNEFFQLLIRENRTDEAIEFANNMHAAVLYVHENDFIVQREKFGSDDVLPEIALEHDFQSNMVTVIEEALKINDEFYEKVIKTDFSKFDCSLSKSLALTIYRLKNNIPDVAIFLNSLKHCRKHVFIILNDLTNENNLRENVIKEGKFDADFLKSYQEFNQNNKCRVP